MNINNGKYIINIDKNNSSNNDSTTSIDNENDMSLFSDNSNELIQVYRNGIMVYQTEEIYLVNEDNEDHV